MNKGAYILITIWTLLALGAFIGSFWCPLVPKIIGIAFGIINLGLFAGMMAAIKGEKKDVQL